MSKPISFFRWHGKKAVLMLILTLTLSLTLVGTTVAFLVVGTDPLINIFLPATLSVEKSDDGRGVINDGEALAYVRAAVVVTWEKTSEEGTIIAKAPIENVDYTYECAEGWVKAIDGFWYYTKPIAPNKAITINMIESVDQIGAAQVGFDLSVDLLFDAIQAVPTRAVTESWSSGVSAVAADGTLNIIIN